MKLLVAGGLGFIGSNFIRHMLTKYGYPIVNLDKMTYCGNPENLQDVENDENYSFVKGDICDKKIVAKAAKDVDIIVNFAAETHVDKSIMEANAFVRTDVLGTHNLLEFSQEKGIRLLQISTDEVYGSTSGEAFSEESPLSPSSPYAASKAAGDLLALSYFKTHGTSVMLTRSSNNFGPYQYPEKFIPLFITNLLENKKVPLYGTGENVRDWLYILDNCEAIDFVLHKGTAGEIYNIGSGNERTNIEMTKLMLQILGKDESMIEFVQDRKGHDFRYSLDFTKIQKLGWKPRFTFDDALKETVEWYKQHETWWKKLKSGEFLDYYKKYYSGLGMK